MLNLLSCTEQHWLDVKLNKLDYCYSVCAMQAMSMDVYELDVYVSSKLIELSYEEFWGYITYSPPKSIGKCVGLFLQQKGAVAVCNYTFMNCQWHDNYDVTQYIYCVVHSIVNSLNCDLTYYLLWCKIIQIIKFDVTRMWCHSIIVQLWHHSIVMLLNCDVTQLWYIIYGVQRNCNSIKIG